MESSMPALRLSIVLALGLSFLGCSPPGTECPGAPDISPGTLDDGNVGVEYSAQLSSGYGDDDNFAVVDGTLPPGLELAADGLLAGTPTDEGAYDFEVETAPEDLGDTQCGPQPASAAYTLTINP